MPIGCNGTRNLYLETSLKVSYLVAGTNYFFFLLTPGIKPRLSALVESALTTRPLCSPIQYSLIPYKLSPNPVLTESLHTVPQSSSHWFLTSCLPIQYSPNPYILSPNPVLTDSLQAVPQSSTHWFLTSCPPIQHSLNPYKLSPNPVLTESLGIPALIVLCMPLVTCTGFSYCLSNHKCRFIYLNVCVVIMGVIFYLYLSVRLLQGFIWKHVWHV